MLLGTCNFTITLFSKDTPYRKYLEGCCEHKIKIDSKVLEEFSRWMIRFRNTKHINPNVTIMWETLTRNTNNLEFRHLADCLQYSLQFVNGIPIQNRAFDITEPTSNFHDTMTRDCLESWVDYYSVGVSINIVPPSIPSLFKLEVPSSKFHTMLPTDNLPPVALGSQEVELELLPKGTKIRLLRNIPEFTLSPGEEGEIVRYLGTTSPDDYWVRHTKTNLEFEATLGEDFEIVKEQESSLAEGTKIKFTQGMLNYCQPGDVGCVVAKTGQLFNEYWVKNRRSVRKFSAVFKEHFELLEIKEELLPKGTSVRFFKDSDYYYEGEIGTILEAVTDPKYTGNYKVQTNIKGHFIIAHYTTDFEVVKDTK